MALADLLNADMATVGAQLRAALAWWVDELSAMVPRRLRGEGARAKVIAEVTGPHPGYARDGQQLAGPPRDGRVTLVLPRAQALVREVLLPRLPRADTRRLIALDLDRLTPFDASAAVFDYQPAPGDAPPGRQRVLLAVATRAAATAALGRAADLGLVPVALGIADRAGRPSFDFLPALREGLVKRPAWSNPRYWWTAAALLLLANVGFAIWRDADDIARLNDIVDAQSDAVQLAQRAKARVRAEDTRRAALVARRAAQDPLPPLAAATAALPPPAWVQRLQWDGRLLRLTGLTTDAVDPVSALRRSGAFASVRAGSSDLPAAEVRFQQFDLTAERAPPPNPPHP